MKSKRSSRQALPISAAAALLSVLSCSIVAGCTNNALPQIPVPKPDEQAALPRWYPEAPWTAKTGQSRIFIEGKIIFDTNKFAIRPGSEKVLKTLLQFVNEHPEVTLLRIEGHTDSRASEEHNQELSAKRALSVCDWLVEQGVDNTRLLAVGFGSSKPIAPNDRPDGRAENRRTEFHVAEVNGRPFNRDAKDPTAGGVVLLVKSLEQRREEEEIARQQRMAKRPTVKPFVPTGNVITEVKPTTPTAKEQGLKPQGEKKE